MSALLPVVAEKQHAELGASVASRWMACPGSIRLSRTVPVPPTTEYAQEGTAAHALAELALRKGVDPDMWLGLTVEGVEVTDDMVDYVRVYVDHCRAFMLPARQHDYWIEHRFNLGALNPPGPMFGTSDFVAYDPAAHILSVVDLKYGQGVVVEAKGNKQLRYYALGSALMLTGRPIDTVCMTIVQPRVQHPDGVIRSDIITYDELIGFAGDLMEAARATQAPDAPLVPGPHCRFCPASGICPAQREAAQAIARIEFDDMPLAVPPAPETLPDEVFHDMLSKLHILDDWMKAMRGHAQARLERGIPVPGFKLVEKRATRRWADENETRQWLEAEGYRAEEIEKRELKSPAQIEKLVGKKNLPSELVTKQSSGYTMVPDSDKRPAVMVTAGHEFTALPPAAVDD